MRANKNKKIIVDIISLVIVILLLLASVSFFATLFDSTDGFFSDLFDDNSSNVGDNSGNLNNPSDDENGEDISNDFRIELDKDHIFF